MITCFAGGKIAKSKDFVWDSTRFSQQMDELRFDLALEEIWKLVQHLNQYIDEQKPWELNKDSSKQAEVAAVMNYLATGLRQVGELLTPFLPDTAEKIKDIFGGASVGELSKVLFERKQ
jgi:methionyl-tRNA synthetase